MHFLVLGDTKLGVFEEILRQKVLASPNFCQILVLGDTAIPRDNGVAVSRDGMITINHFFFACGFLQQHGNSLVAKC